MIDISQLLSGVFINRYADIYLDFLGLDKQSLTYRRLKNAVILFALIGGDTESVCRTLAETESIPAEQIRADILSAIDIDTIHDKFNAAYCDEHCTGFMPQYKRPDDCIAFLGITFLYILETNYPEYINLIQNSEFGIRN